MRARAMIVLLSLTISHGILFFLLPLPMYMLLSDTKRGTGGAAGCFRSPPFSHGPLPLFSFLLLVLLRRRPLLLLLVVLYGTCCPPPFLCARTTIHDVSLESLRPTNPSILHTRESSHASPLNPSFLLPLLRLRGHLHDVLDHRREEPVHLYVRIYVDVGVGVG